MEVSQNEVKGLHTSPYPTTIASIEIANYPHPASQQASQPAIE